MLTVMDTIHASVLCTLDIAATVANIVLVYAIITRLSFLRETFSQVYLYLGPCSNVGLWFCHLCQTIHIFCVCHSTVILLHSFCFRLYILRDKLVHVSIPSTSTSLAICLLLYIPTMFMMYLFYVSFEYTPNKLMKSLHFDEYPTTWHSTVLSYHFVIALSYVVILSPAAMIIIFFVRLRLISEISKMALTYQMLLPAGVSLASAAWLSEVTGLWWNETPERLIMTLSSFFALGSPLINLTFLPPYRRMFGKGGKTNALGASTTASATHFA